LTGELKEHDASIHAMQEEAHAAREDVEEAVSENISKRRYSGRLESISLELGELKDAVQTTQEKDSELTSSLIQSEVAIHVKEAMAEIHDNPLCVSPREEEETRNQGDANEADLNSSVVALMKAQEEVKEELQEEVRETREGLTEMKCQVEALLSELRESRELEEVRDELRAGLGDVSIAKMGLVDVKGELEEIKNELRAHEGEIRSLVEDASAAGQVEEPKDSSSMEGDGIQEMRMRLLEKEVLTLKSGLESSILETECLTKRVTEEMEGMEEAVSILRTGIHDGAIANTREGGEEKGMDKRLEMIEESVSELESQFESIQEQVEQDHQEAKEAGAKVEGLQASVEGLQDQDQDLEVKIQGIQDLEGSMEAIQSSVQDLEASVGDLKEVSQTMRIENGIKALKSVMSNLQKMEMEGRLAVWRYRYSSEIQDSGEEEKDAVVNNGNASAAEAGRVKELAVAVTSLAATCTEHAQNIKVFLSF